MKVYQRVGNREEMGGVVFTEGHRGYVKILQGKRWVQTTGGWKNDELLDRRNFQLVGNNFRLK